MFASLILAHTLGIQAGQGWPRPVAAATLGQHILPLCKLWHCSRRCSAAPFISGQAAVWAALWKGGLCSHRLRDTERGNKCWGRRRKPKGLRQMCHSELRRESLLLELSLVFQTWDAVCGCHPAFSFIIHQSKNWKLMKERVSKKHLIHYCFPFPVSVYNPFSNKGTMFSVPHKGIRNTNELKIEYGGFQVL